MKRPTILIVDDDESIRFAFIKTFKSFKSNTLTASNGAEAIKIINEKNPSLVFLDIAMPGLSGMEVLEQIKKKNPDLPVIMITGYGSMQTAIQAMQLGAYDYLTKPLDIDKVRITGQRALELVKMRQQLDVLQRQLKEKDAPHRTEIIGKNAQMEEVYKKIGVVSTTPNTTNILILGDTGTGKELIARAIHESGPYPDEPFLAINCTVLPETLLESELFGHEKGAFTGADRSKPGKFEQAKNGTLFLDEIGDMPEFLQKKILRVVQERTFERLGGNKIIPLNARIIAATHRDLTKAVQKGDFRKDLYYRLNVIEIVLPPLKKRKEDIELIANHFFMKYNERFNKSITHISVEVFDLLKRYDFPGNVRELENLIERAMALERSTVLRVESFPRNLFYSQSVQSIDIQIPFDDFTRSKQTIVEAFEKKFLVERLTTTSGNVSEAARISGIERQSFQRLMKKYNLSSEDFRRK